MAATYGMGYAGEQLGLPGEVTWILSVATGCTVSMVGGKLLFRDIDKGIIQECTTEDLAKITGETSGALDMTQVGKSVTAEEIDIYLQYKKEGSLYRFSREEREAIQRMQRMDIPDEELKKVLQVKQSIVIENVVNEGGTYSGDLMSAEEAARYSEHWRELGIGSDKTYNDFIMNNPGKNIDDYFRLVKEQSPWPDGYMPSEHMVTLKSGDTFNMVLDSKQKTSNPGGFALKEDIPSVEFARKDMAIKYGWKDDCGKVVTYRVKDGVELICPAGPIGPQIDLEVDMYLPGNSSLTQYDLFNGLGRINRMDFIEVVPGSIKRIK